MRRADPSGVPGNAGGRPPLGRKIDPPPPRGAPGGPAAAPASPAPAPAPAPETRAAPRSARVADLATALALVAIGALVLVSSVRMGIGWGSDGPEAGFVPFWLSLVLLSCCALILVHALRRPAPPKPFVRREQLRRVAQVVAPAAGMILLTPYLGLYVATALYMCGYMRLYGRYSWLVSALVPLAFVLLVFAVFERWFLVPLPKGPLEAWLGY